MRFQGENEIRLIAQNYEHRFSELLRNMYDTKRYKFQHATEGIWNSLNAFVDVLFGDSAHTKINAELSNDTKF